MRTMKRAGRLLLYCLFVVVCVIVVGLVVLVVGRIDETVEGFGMVSPVSRADVAPEISGIVRDVLVSEGETVSESDTLFLIHSHELEFKVEQANVALAEARSSLQRAIDEYHNVTTSRSYEIGMILADLNEAEKRMDYHKANIDRSEALHDKGLITDAQYEKVKLDYESSKSYLEILQARIGILKRQYERRIEELRRDCEIADGAQELARLNLERTVVRSPMSGTVLTRRPQRFAGTAVSAGQPVMTVGDLEDLCFIVNLNEVDVVELRVGQRARIFLNSFPHRQYKVFEGEVVEIPSIPQIANNIVTYEVIVTIDEPWVEKSGERIDLRYGLTGRAEIVTKPNMTLISAFLDGISR